MKTRFLILIIFSCMLLAWGCKTRSNCNCPTWGDKGQETEQQPG